MQVAVQTIPLAVTGFQGRAMLFGRLVAFFPLKAEVVLLQFSEGMSLSHKEEDPKVFLGWSAYSISMQVL